MNYADFFSQASGDPTRQPYDYQCRLACGEQGPKSRKDWLSGPADCPSRLINIPTGLGKTAAVVLAWLWNRVFLQRPDWPRRLVYCLPMRTLVEQTRDEVAKWLQLLASKHPGFERVRDNSPILLMGGEDLDSARREWDIHPERDAILIGTQDMLLSRALNRGYGMSRYRWPMHFGLLNNDCLWVMDETQLMGPGLWTSGQLDWMRNHRFRGTKPCVTWWMSATNSPVFLDTPDRRKQRLTAVPVLEIGDDRKAHARLNPTRPLRFWKGSEPNSKSKKKGPLESSFAESLASAILQEHAPGTLSLVVCNSVRAAQELYRLLGSEYTILLTSRFRRGDRASHTKRLLAFEEQRKATSNGSGDDTQRDSLGLVCVSTQVIEAGVDISARRLWLEAAPWPSALQRLGRLNRDGRSDGKAAAFVFQWPDERKKTKGQPVGPYESKDIDVSVKLLAKLAEIYETEPTLGASLAVEKLRESSEAAMSAALKPKDEPFPRAIDVHGLFSTEPDLFGGFTDVSVWVRGEDRNADVTVFWRDFDAKRGPGKSATLTGPAFDPTEGCAVAIHRFRDLLGDKGRALVWDDRTEEWQSTWPGDLCPGMVVMLPRSAGGYSQSLGWTGRANDKLSDALPPGRFSETFEEDVTSEQAGWVTLESHLADTKAAAKQIVASLQLPEELKAAVVTAAEWHDIGKSHRIWQSALPLANAPTKQLWAKAPFVFALSGKNSAAFRESTQRLIEEAGFKARFLREEVKDEIPSQLWTVNGKIRDTLSQRLLSAISEQQESGLKGSMRRFLPRPAWDKPCIRHEAASALAAWVRYFKDGVACPGLTIFLIACHHGKIRTALYARGTDGDDVCGVPRESNPLPWAGGTPMDFSCAATGTGGKFSDDGLTFFPSTPSWTALVADILGGWEQRTEEAPTPPPIALRDGEEPRLLGPFSLAYLESLICAADIHASKSPSDRRYV